MRIIVIMMAALSTSCATFVRGGSESLVIETEPSAAEAMLSTGQYCVTPCELEVKRKGDIVVTVKKEGYKEVKTALVSSIDGGSMGVGTAVNFLFLPIVNDIVDYNTGANYSHKPNPLVIKLISVDSDSDYEYIAAPETTPASTESADEPGPDIDVGI